MSHLSLSISVESLQKQLGTNLALKGISTDFTAGLMHGVIGPEGAGKTTLLRHLLGLLTPGAGRVVYRKGINKNRDNDQNETVAQGNSEVQCSLSEIRSLFSYMPQQQSLYADLSIDEHLHFFKEMYALDESEFRTKREQLLGITRLAPFVDRLAGQLSGGMYKKLGLMCALMSSPQVLILDEPTNGVDPISRREFWDLLYQLRKEKILIIVATAYMDEAERCSKVHLINEGRLLAAGEPRALLQQRHVKSFDEFFLSFKGGENE